MSDNGFQTLNICRCRIICYMCINAFLSPTSQSGKSPVHQLQPPEYNLCSLNPDAVCSIMNACDANLQRKARSTSARTYGLRKR